MEIVDSLNEEVKSELAIPNVFQSNQARAELESVEDKIPLPSKIKALNGPGKLAKKRRRTISKHDVKGAFLNAKIPEGKIVVASLPALWVRWGLGLF